MTEPAAIPTRYDPPGAALRSLMLALALVALGVSAYLLYVSVSGGVSVPGCGPGSGCDKVLASEWAVVLGLPVALLSVGVYLAMAAVMVHISPAATYSRQRNAWIMLLVLTAVAAAAAVWFIGLQIFQIKSLCKFCLAVHGCGLALAAIVFGCAPIGPRRLMPEEPDDPMMIGRLALGGVLIVGLLGAGLLAGTQILVKPQRTHVGLLNGQVSFDPNDVPILGRPDAPHLVVSLFDYACPHCRRMHGYLLEAHRRYGDDLAIVTLPIPLNASCNPTVEHTEPRFEDSCRLAKNALAVWRARPEAFAEFDHWLFESQDPRTANQADARAAELVGQAALDHALADPRIDQQLQLAVQLHRLSMGEDGAFTSIPKLIFPDRFFVGVPADAPELFAFLEDALGLRPPAP